MRYIIFLLFFLPFFANSQVKNEPFSCQCADNFDSLISKVKENYVDYSFRIHDGNYVAFQKHTDSLRTKAQIAQKPSECFRILSAWVAFFQDPHFYLSPNTHSPEEVRLLFPDTEKTTLSQDQISNYLEKSKLDPIEGIWQYESQTKSRTFRLTIIKDKKKKGRDFVGIMSNTHGFWAENDIRLEIQKVNETYQATYYNEYHVPVQTSLHLITEGLRLKHVGTLKKVYPTNTTPSATPIALVKYNGFLDHLNRQSLDSSTLYLRISHLLHELANETKQFIEESKPFISRSKYLIVDLRDNPGGAYAWIEELYPYLYTRPIIIPGGVRLASTENVEKFAAASVRAAGLWDEKKYGTFADFIARLRNHPNELVGDIEGDDTLHLDTIARFPEKIAFLVNENTVSAAEMFLIYASQSEKVQVFGQPTRGGTFSGEIHTIEIPCSLVKFTYPMTRGRWYPPIVSKEGKIIPDVIIPYTEPDWIQFIRNYWQKQK